MIIKRINLNHPSTDYNMNLPAINHANLAFPMPDAYPLDSEPSKTKKEYIGVCSLKFPHDFSMVPDMPNSFGPIDTLVESPSPQELMSAIDKLQSDFYYPLNRG